MDPQATDMDPQATDMDPQAQVEALRHV